MTELSEAALAALRAEKASEATIDAIRSEDAIAVCDNNRKEARKWHKLGVYTIPVPRGSKNPNRQKWQEERIEEDQIDTWFDGPCNHGILLGEPSNWKVDADFDSKEAREVWPDFFPEATLAYGFESCP